MTREVGRRYDLQNSQPDHINNLKKESKQNKTKKPTKNKNKKKPSHIWKRRNPLLKRYRYEGTTDYPSRIDQGVPAITGPGHAL